jgi:RNA polymerase sigma-70 factor (ECF subfamily)
MASERWVRTPDPPPGARQRREDHGVIRVLPFVGDDAALVEGLRRGHPAAATYLYDRYADLIHGALYRILGPDSELEDVVHDTFIRVLQSIGTLREPRALKSWIMSIAVFAAKNRIQMRTRRRWLSILPPEDVPEPEPFAPEPEANEALAQTYRILKKLRADERIAVVLHIIEQMTIEEAAEVCQVSPSTFKRRLRRGERLFLKLVKAEPALRDWVGEGAS